MCLVITNKVIHLLHLCIAGFVLKVYFILGQLIVGGRVHLYTIHYTGWVPIRDCDCWTFISMNNSK